MEKSTSAQTAKIAVSPESDNALSVALETVNSGFLGGKINKCELTSWLIMDALNNLSESKVEKIRKAFFNEITYLDSLVKLSRKNGLDKLTTEQIATVQSLFGSKNDKARKPKEGSKGSEAIE
jgi:hypothetical protein